MENREFWREVKIFSIFAAKQTHAKINCFGERGGKLARERALPMSFIVIHRLQSAKSEGAVGIIEH